MKIAYLLGSLNRGGTETLLLDVFRNAQANQLEAIGVYRKSGVLEAEFIQSGVPMLMLSVGRNILDYLFRLRKLLISNGIDIIHAQQPLDALYARIACVGLNRKVILSLHGYDFKDTRLAKIMLKIILKRTNTNIYVSKHQQHYYLRKYSLQPQKQLVVYNGIAFEKLNLSATHSMTLSSTPDKITLRKELPISSDTLLLGTVGNFVPGRDQFTLCRFLKKLKEKDVEFHFVFVGKRMEQIPHLHDDCVRYCRENELSRSVSFLGSRTDVPDILVELDAFLYATDHDTFGIAVVEALAVGVPVFVNDWEVMNEITENGKFATIYKTKDVDDLLQQFMLFLQNKQGYLTKANEAAGFVRTNYSIEKHIEKLKKVYESSEYKALSKE